MNYSIENIVFPPSAWPPGLSEQIRAAGHDYENHNGSVYATDGPAVQAIIDAHDAMPFAIAEKIAALADYRWSKETAGIVVDGITVETTDRSKTLITGAMLMASQNPSATFKFKTTAGDHVEINAAAMINIYVVMGLHVQACFAKEEAIATQIRALATWQEVEAFDINAAWSA